MEDKCIMENLLLLEKGVCDLYLHGTIEASTTGVHQAFDGALKDSLQLKEQIYDKMSAKGWYPTQPVEEQKIQQVRQKFSTPSMS